MLYKKYHRSYIKQFKKGMKLFWDVNLEEVVIREPFLYVSKNGGGSAIFIRTDHCAHVVLLCSGRFQGIPKLIGDGNVIQKIS